METIVNFISDYYLWFIIGGIVLILALIGYYAEKNNLLKSDKKDSNIENETFDTKDNSVNQNNEAHKFEEKAKDESLDNVENTLKDAGLATDFIEDDLAEASLNPMKTANENSPASNKSLVTKGENIIEIDNNLEKTNSNQGIENPELIAEMKAEPSMENVPEKEMDKIANDTSYEEIPIDSKDTFDTSYENKPIDNKNINEVYENTGVNNETIAKTNYENLSDNKESLDVHFEQPVFDNVASNNIEPITNQNLNNEQLTPTDEGVVNNQNIENKEETEIANKMLQPEITDEEILSQTKDLDAIKEELNKIVFETNLDEKYLKKLNNDKDDFADIDIKLPDIDTLRLERNKKNINNDDIWNF